MVSVSRLWIERRQLRIDFFGFQPSLELLLAGWLLHAGSLQQKIAFVVVFHD
jgi:hypothetical protein